MPHTSPSCLTFDDYQKTARETAIYPEVAAVVYPVMGLCGEAGEVAEKLLKVLFPNPSSDYPESPFQRELFDAISNVVWECNKVQALSKRIRDNPEGKKVPDEDYVWMVGRIKNMNTEAKGGLLSEVADGLWFGANALWDLGAQFSAAARENLEKLASRKARGKIGGSGDTR